MGVLLPLGEVEVVEVLLPRVEEVEVVDHMCQVEVEEVEAQVNLAEEAEVVEGKHLVVVGVLEVVLILLRAEEGEEEEELQIVGPEYCLHSPGLWRRSSHQLGFPY